MKIPKKIEKLLDKRENLAEQLCNASNELDDWLVAKGADLLDPQIADCTISGCRIYCEPNGAKQSVRDYIINQL